MVVIYNVFAPFSLIRFGVGDDLVMDHLKKDPAAIAHAGAAPIMLPATDNSDLIARYAAMIDGLLLPGGHMGKYWCIVVGYMLSNFGQYCYYRRCV